MHKIWKNWQTFLELISNYTKVAEYKINIPPKSAAFLHTSNKQMGLKNLKPNAIYIITSKEWKTLIWI
jgi:hypothetical protein